MNLLKHSWRKLGRDFQNKILVSILNKFYTKINGNGKSQNEFFEFLWKNSWMRSEKDHFLEKRMNEEISGVISQSILGKNWMNSSGSKYNKSLGSLWRKQWMIFLRILQIYNWTNYWITFSEYTRSNIWRNVTIPKEIFSSFEIPYRHITPHELASWFKNKKLKTTLTIDD